MASAGTRLRKRTSYGSSPASRAIASSVTSITKQTPARATPRYGQDGRLVGRRRPGAAAIRVHHVGAGQDRCDLRRLQAGGKRIGGVGAGIDRGFRVDRQQSPVGVRIGSDFVLMLAAVGVAGELLAPILDPAHRMAEAACQPAGAPLPRPTACPCSRNRRRHRARPRARGPRRGPGIRPARCARYAAIALSCRARAVPADGPIPQRRRGLPAATCIAARCGSCDAPRSARWRGWRSGRPRPRFPGRRCRPSVRAPAARRAAVPPACPPRRAVRRNRPLRRRQGPRPRHASVRRRPRSARRRGAPCHAPAPADRMA